MHGRTPGILIAGTGSGCGKTSAVIAILGALKERGVSVCSFKCGPDYIDPMFHERALGIPSRNLDAHLLDRDTLKALYIRNSRGYDLALTEGVMGYFDGAGWTDEGSSHDLAGLLSVPTVLVLNCRGQSRSVMAQMKGFSDFAGDRSIRGVLFNEAAPRLVPELSRYAKSLGLVPLGYLPHLKRHLDSRHLGLVLPGEEEDMEEKVAELVSAAKSSVDLDALLKLAEEAGTLTAPDPVLPAPILHPVRIGVAYDPAFCFYYADNLDLLRVLGAEPVFFSPMKDPHLPEDLSGLYLGGGYPELHARELSGNSSLRKEIRETVQAGMPCFAECGGFLYLHESLEDPEEDTFPMAGVIPAKSRFTGKLQHFGYVDMTAEKDTLLCPLGTHLKGHEFHRCISDAVQDAFLEQKGGETFGGYVADRNLLAGFAHLHFYTDPGVAQHFVRACDAYRNEKEKRHE